MANKPKYRTMPPRPGNSSADRELTASERGYGSRWSKRIAPSIRERDRYLCAKCLEIGGLKMAVESMLRQTKAMTVDHRIPAHVIGPEHFYDEENLQLLCDQHNAEKTAEDLKIYGAAPR